MQGTKGIRVSAAVGEPEISHDAIAIEKVYREHHAPILRAAYRITGDWSDAEDVLQTVFLRLVRRSAGQADHLRAIPGQAAPVNLGSYLYRSAVNGALDTLRMRQENRNVALDDAAELASTTPLPDRTQISGEAGAWFRLALARLHPRTAEMFALRYLEGLSNPEIAKLMRTSQAVVAVTLYRTRRKLETDYRTHIQKKKRTK